MLVAHEDLQQCFISKVCEAAPTVELYTAHDLPRLEDIGKEFQRLAQGLFPHVEKGFPLTDESLEKIARNFIKYDTKLPGDKEPLKQFIGNQLLHHTKGITHEGLKWMEKETGFTLRALQQYARRNSIARHGSVFSGWHNVKSGLGHVFSFHPGVNGRNTGAGLLAYSGVAAGLRGVYDLTIGTEVIDPSQPKDPDGNPSTRRETHPWRGAVEVGAGLLAIAGALKIADQNVLRLK